MTSLPSLLRNQILSVIYTVQTFQYKYIWLLNLNWNSCIALKSGGPTRTLTPTKKCGGKSPGPQASDTPANKSVFQEKVKLKVEEILREF